MRNFDSLARPLIYLITDGTITVENFDQKKAQIIRLVRAAAETKISLIQIREKRLPARLVYELASSVVEITKNTPTKILINDRADIALAANADGVHLTAASLSAEIIRRDFPENFIVGVSAHTLEKAEDAKRSGADFATFSPIFPSPGKSDWQGIEPLKKACEKLKPFPVIALGGIDESNYRKVTRAGADGFAAIRFLNDEANLRKLNEELSTDEHG